MGKSYGVENVNVAKPHPKLLCLIVSYTMYMHMYMYDKLVILYDLVYVVVV